MTESWSWGGVCDLALEDAVRYAMVKVGSAEVKH
jgi:hypothetical protein